MVYSKKVLCKAVMECRTKKGRVDEGLVGKTVIITNLVCSDILWAYGVRAELHSFLVISTENVE